MRGGEAYVLHMRRIFCLDRAIYARKHLFVIIEIGRFSENSYMAGDNLKRKNLITDKGRLFYAVWLTVIILSIQSLWSATGGNYIFSEQLKTLPVAMQQIVNGGVARAGAGAAVSVVMMSVPIIAFVLSQSQIIETMATSGLKE